MNIYTLTFSFLCIYSTCFSQENNKAYIKSETEIASSVNIFVRDANNLNYLNSAMIVLGSDTAYTDNLENGLSVFVDVSYSDSLNLDVFLTGYVPKRTFVEIKNEVEEFTLDLTPRGGLTFNIIDSVTNLPVYEAGIVCNEGNGTYITSENGTYYYGSYENLINTYLRYAVSKDGYKTVTDSVFITGATQTEIIKLSASTPFSTLSIDIKKPNGFNAWGIYVTINDETKYTEGETLVFNNVPFDDSIPIKAIHKNNYYLPYYDTLKVNSAYHQFEIQMEHDTINARVRMEAECKGIPIADAMLVINIDTLYSSSSGSYISIKLLKEKYHKYFAFKQGYYPIIDSLYITADESYKTITLSFIKDTVFSFVEFIITDSLGPIKNVNILSDPTSVSNFKLRTDSLGKAKLKTVYCDDSIRYSINKSGYKTTHANTKLLPDSTIYIEKKLDYYIPVKFYNSSSSLSAENACIIINNDTLSINIFGFTSTFVYKPKQYNYKISADGYYDICDSVFISPTDTIVNFNLIQYLFNVKFIIHDDDTPIVDAAISINDDAKNTDENGISIFEYKPKGEYSFSISKEYYKDSVGSFIVENKNIIIEISLSKINGVNSIKPEFNLYPNPINNELYIKNAESSFYKIFSLNGKVVIEGEIETKLFKINTSQLNPGMYYILLESDSYRKAFKLIKE